jgi:5-methylcytosine-specific restriction endonuclease McrA
MTKEERNKRNEEIRAYKAQGHTNKETAKVFGISYEHCKLICRGLPTVYKNQYTENEKSKEKRLENCKRIIKRGNPDFEYVSGFTDVDGKVNVRCIVCDNVFEMSMITLRVKKRIHQCPYCSEIKRAEEREQRKQQQREAREAERIQQREAKMVARYRNAPQITMKRCVICGDVFLEKGNKKYCSKKCQDQNKWTMKDGYRYLFPLEEVYERDNGICYLCGEPCDWNDKEIVNGYVVYGNRYPSRDHVIPKSKGGKNTIDNIRLAHRICNTWKRDDNPPAFATTA